MKKQVFVLSVFFVVSAFVHGAVWTGWDNGDVWSQSSNWSTGSLPGAGEKVQILYPSAMPCILDSDAGVTIGELVIGDNNGPASMIVKTGGSLTVGGWTAVGYNRAAYLTIEAGTLTCYNYFAVGMFDDVAGAMILTMTGGSVTVNNTFFHGLYFDGSAVVEVRTNLDDGILEVGAINLKTGVLDITEGTLIVNGNVIGTIAGYESSGRMTAYDGEGALVYDYNVTHADKTTITAERLQGDMDGDGDVEFDDLVSFWLEWLSPDCDSPANFDELCGVDFGDFAKFSANWLTYPTVVVAPDYAAGVELGRVEHDLINENSGIVISRKNANTMYAIEDGGSHAGFWALTPSGRHLGQYFYSGASNRDTEDVSIGPGPIPGKDYIYVGDIGDNGGSRSSIQVYRAEEPVINAATQVNSPVTATLPCEKITLLYPDGARDSEAFFIDPITGDFFLISKRDGNNTLRLYRAPASQLVDNATVTMTFEHLLSIRNWCTGADITSDGTLIVTCSNVPESGRVFTRQPGETVSEALKASPPYNVPYFFEHHQLEAICFDTDYNVYTASEGVHRPIYKYLAQ